MQGVAKLDHIIYPLLTDITYGFNIITHDIGAFRLHEYNFIQQAYHDTAPTLLNLPTWLNMV